MSDDPILLEPEQHELWIPSASVTNHNGDPLPPDRVFFAPPPPEIGEVVSAYSTLPTGKRPMPWLSRMALSGFAGSAGAAALHFLGVQETVLQVLCFLALAPLVWWLTGFSHKVSYVGKEGIARLRCQGRPDHVTRTEVFRFDSAAELRTGQTRHYTNGVYTGTSYNFTWTGPDGRKKFRLNGTYHGEKKPPKPKDPFHFAEAAEVAWSIYLFDQASRELETNGSIRFNLGGSDWIAVGPGFVDLSRKGNVERWTPQEIGGLTIGDGVFKIKRTDAKEGWFSSQGVFQFRYQSMANARLFLIAIQRLLGYQFQ